MVDQAEAVVLLQELADLVHQAKVILEQLEIQLAVVVVVLEQQPF
jgi:hypothetical protein